MQNAGLFMELVATYRKHGWELRSVLLQPATRKELELDLTELLKGVALRDAGLEEAFKKNRETAQNLIGGVADRA